MLDEPVHHGHRPVTFKFPVAGVQELQRNIPAWYSAYVRTATLSSAVETALGELAGLEDANLDKYQRENLKAAVGVLAKALAESASLDATR